MAFPYRYVSWQQLNCIWCMYKRYLNDFDHIVVTNYSELHKECELNVLTLEGG